MGQPLWAEDAVTMASLLRAGEISPLDLLTATQERVAAVNPVVNALPTLCFDRARRRLGEGADLSGSTLGGLPVPIKDSYAVAGVRTTFGSRVYADAVPDRSDFLVEALEASGGVVFAKSNTPEFEAGANTFNDVFGVTRNPWDTRLSPAGSSGGSAAGFRGGARAGPSRWRIPCE